jgi:hypothetical protein
MMTMMEVEEQYREAFEEFSKKAEYVQSLAAQTNDPKAFEAAVFELERAHLAYNQARDLMLRSLLPASAQLEPFAEDHNADVPTIAELLWEGAGRPDGTAERDWQRAEAIVKRAAATASCQ